MEDNGCEEGCRREKRREENPAEGEVYIPSRQHSWTESLGNGDIIQKYTKLVEYIELHGEYQVYSTK